MFLLGQCSFGFVVMRTLSYTATVGHPYCTERADSNFLELEVYYPELPVEPTLVQIRNVYQTDEQL